LDRLEASPGLILIGETDAHRENHYGTLRTVVALRDIGDAWVQLYPNYPVGINDMSLEWGGLFDLDSSWAPPHKTHRRGENVDVRIRDKNEEQQFQLRKIITKEGVCSVSRHGNHFHLTC
jgi:hypothetical protein